MQLGKIGRLELPPTADMHVHLRQGELMDLVVPTVSKGGVDTVFVMPNLIPPLTTVAQVLEYRSRLCAITQDVQFLMSLLWVTTNSESGVTDLESFYATFAAMEEHDLVLNLHGEVLESIAPADTTLEEAFLPTLKALHERFPRLRIVLEHCTTVAAVEAVRACGPTVGATITAHHLYLTSDEANCDPFAFCKPIPKKPTDRRALVSTVVSGDPKFFFGSDSAPHPIQSKVSAAQGKAPAGVYTQPFATQLVLLALEEAIERGEISETDVSETKLEGFLSKFGRRFYKLPEVSTKKIVLERKGEKIPTSVLSEDGNTEVGISRAGVEVFSLRWELA